MDIIPANGGKGLGVKKVLDYVPFTKEEAIAFGDSINDIEMLQAVGTGIAMDNASQDVICGSVREEEIYRYCKENHLI